MIAWARTLAFMAVFYAGSVPFVLATPLTAAIGRRALLANVKAWARFHRGVTRLILGIDTRVEGDLHATEPVLYAAKHQSMYETIELGRMLDDPAIVMKRELVAIPLWGWAAKRYGAIAVDRDASAGALRRMLIEARAALDHHRSILIFPEGTRVDPGDRPPLRAGFSGLYKMLKLPVIPVAIDSGTVWPRHGPKRAGLVTFRFGAPIPPGLPRAEAEARVHAAINALDPP